MLNNMNEPQNKYSESKKSDPKKKKKSERKRDRSKKTKRIDIKLQKKRNLVSSKGKQISIGLGMVWGTG